MGKLSHSFRQNNKTTKDFREQYKNLPPHIQGLTRAACERFDKDASHRSLRHHQLKESGRSSALPGSFSVSVTMQYRAIYVVVDGENVWYWIGTHAEYDKYLGS